VKLIGIVFFNSMALQKPLSVGFLFFIVPNGLAMCSSGLTRKNYRMRTELTNKNNLRLQHLTAITYSLCCTSVKKDEL